MLLLSEELKNTVVAYLETAKKGKKKDDRGVRRAEFTIAQVNAWQETHGNTPRLFQEVIDLLNSKEFNSSTILKETIEEALINFFDLKKYLSERKVQGRMPPNPVGVRFAPIGMLINDLEILTTIAYDSALIKKYIAPKLITELKPIKATEAPQSDTNSMNTLSPRNG